MKAFPSEKRGEKLPASLQKTCGTIIPYQLVTRERDKECNRIFLEQAVLSKRQQNKVPMGVVRKREQHKTCKADPDLFVDTIMSNNRLFTIREPHLLIKMFRTRPRSESHKKLTQEALAALIFRDPRAIREWESGVRLPAPESLMRLISAFVEQHIFIEGKEREEAEHLWDVVSASFAKFTRFTEYPPFDEHWFEALIKRQRQKRDASCRTPTEPSSFLTPQVDPTDNSGNFWLLYTKQNTTDSPPRTDWGEAIDGSSFFGREQELARLEDWIVTERCRLITLLGMGGIGKSALAVKLARQVRQHFDVVLWTSLCNAPPLEELLANCLRALSCQQTNIPESVEQKITLVLSFFRKFRCLLVLDNVESILQGRHRAQVGLYRECYEEYGAFLRLVGQTMHRSCLMLVGREKPKGVGTSDGRLFPNRSLTLAGLSERACLMLLKDKGLFGSVEAWHTLVRNYAGNPWALQFVAGTLQEICGGDIQAFLSYRKTVFGDIRDLLDEQFERLSDVEREFLFWLAIEREMTSLASLQADMELSGANDNILEAFNALVRHSSWVERSESEAMFTLQPMVMEYITDRLLRPLVYFSPS